MSLTSQHKKMNYLLSVNHFHLKWKLMILCPIRFYYKFIKFQPKLYEVLACNLKSKLRCSHTSRTELRATIWQLTLYIWNIAVPLPVCDGGAVLSNSCQLSKQIKTMAVQALWTRMLMVDNANSILIQLLYLREEKKVQTLTCTEVLKYSYFALFY